MSNCKSIEVVVFYPAIASSNNNTDPRKPQTRNQDEDKESVPERNIEFDKIMSATQEPTADLRSPTPRDDTPYSQQQQQQQQIQEQGIFRFLDLPLELRLKIYALLLPPRSHTIVTQIPHNGYFYNTSTVPFYSASSFYPFGTSAPAKTKTQNLTTYKVLNRNFRMDFPEASIHPELLRVCRQITNEAEPVLYGASDTEWDFGTSIEAMAPFFGDRSQEARNCVGRVKVAREIRDDATSEHVDCAWERFCKYITTELLGLRTVNLTIWSSSGSTASFPSSILPEGTEEKESEVEMRRKWKEWEFTKRLLEKEGLRNAKITWWGFQGSKREGDPEGVRERGQGFDSWLARRMVQDKVVRERMIGEGAVREESIVLAGGGA
jgi:hypothetical protein